MLGALIIAIPLIIYIVGALSVSRKDLKHPDDFFVAFKKVGVTAFSSSSIAYAFQVSTIFPFLLWGASRFYLVPAVNTICWGVGIYLFYLSFDRYKEFIGTDVTLHGFLGAKYGRLVRIIASWLTIVGFLGFATAETYFGSRVLLSIIPNKDIFYFLIVGALLFVYGYIAYGGQVSSLRTDQLQLVIAYVGVFGLLLYLLSLCARHSTRASGGLFVGLLLLLIYIPVILIYRRCRFIRLSENDLPFTRHINGLLNFIIVALLLMIVVAAAATAIRGRFDFAGGRILNLEGFGVPGLLSLMVLPLSWQFVDLTNWQRLLAVKADDGKDLANMYSNIRRGLLIYSIESPFTWIIFLFFGLLVVSAFSGFTFNDLLVDFPRQLMTSGFIVERAFGYIFIVSILAIMLSTVDSFIVGAMFTFVYDSYAPSRRLLDRGRTEAVPYHRGVNVGRIFGLIIVLLGAFLLILFDRHIKSGGELFINLLLAFYSAQLSFVPLVLGILFLKVHPSPVWANISMIAGAIGGISLGIYAVIWDISLAWYPILVCIALSGSIYLTGLAVKQHVFSVIVKFCRANPISVPLLILSVGFSAAWPRKPRWFNWEIAGFFSTITYSVYIYLVEGLIRGKKFLIRSTYRRQKIGWVVLCNLALGLATLLSLNGQTHWINIPEYRYPTAIKMGCLWLSSVLFAVTVKMLGKGANNDKIARSFRQSFRYSDGPICVGFGVLLLYACLLGEYRIRSDGMESFFAGAIAFQMMISNIVWLFTDNALVETNHTALEPTNHATVRI